MQASNLVPHFWSSSPQNASSFTPTVHLSGDYDSFNTPSLWAEIEDVLRGDGEGLILDANDVTFFDASGIRVLVKAAEQLAAAAQTLTLRTPSHSVDRVLRICGLEALFDSGSDPAADTPPTTSRLT